MTRRMLAMGMTNNDNCCPGFLLLRPFIYYASWMFASFECQVAKSPWVVLRSHRDMG